MEPSPIEDCAQTICTLAEVLPPAAYLVDIDEHKPWSLLPTGPLAPFLYLFHRDLWS